MPCHQASQNISTEVLATWLAKLARVDRYYHDELGTEACIICIKCGYAIKADGDQVTWHLHEKHDVNVTSAAVLCTHYAPLAAGRLN